MAEPIKVSIDLTSKEIEKARPPKATDIPVFATSTEKSQQRLLDEVLEEELANQAKREKTLQRKGKDKILDLEGVEEPTNFENTKRQLDGIFTWFRALDRANIISGSAAGLVRSLQTLSGSRMAQDAAEQERISLRQEQFERQMAYNQKMGLPVGPPPKSLQGSSGGGGGGPGGFLGSLLGGGAAGSRLTALLTPVLTAGAFLLPILTGLQIFKDNLGRLSRAIQLPVQLFGRFQAFLERSTDALQGLNGSIATAIALRERDLILAKLEQGREVGGILARRQGVQGQRDRALIELQTEIIRLLGPIANATQQAITPAIETISTWVQLMDNDVLLAAAKAQVTMNQTVAMQNQMLPKLLKEIRDRLGLSAAEENDMFKELDKFLGFEEGAVDKLGETMVEQHRVANPLI